MVDDMGMAEEAIDDALVESAGYDELEASLDEAEALIKRNAESMNGYLARSAELESQIIHQTGISACRIEERERLQKQIAALQEIAVEGLAWKLMAEHNEFSSIGGPKVKDLVDFLDDARRQLSEEHPEAFR